MAAPNNPAAIEISRPSANQMLEKRVIRKPVPPNQARNAVRVTKLNGDTGDWWLACASAPPLAVRPRCMSGAAA